VLKQLGDDSCKGNRPVVPSITYVPILVFTNRNNDSLYVLQPLQWCCVDCVIHHERDVREEQKYVCVEQASNSKRDCDA